MNKTCISFQREQGRHTILDAKRNGSRNFDEVICLADLNFTKKRGSSKEQVKIFKKKVEWGKWAVPSNAPPVSFLLGLIQCTESQVKNHPYQFIPLISKGKKITKMSQKISSDITETSEVLRLTISVEFMAE